jgi:RNA recognition motif-containing protein
MEEVKDMFPQPHKDKIKHVRKANARGSNHPYAIVYFNSIEEAQAAIESLTHSKIKFGDDFASDHDRAGSYGPRGGSFGGGSYPDRKSGGSDSEMNRGGFGRGGRGGRGGPGSRGGGGPGSSGTYSSRGSGSHSPAPGRGGSSARGRGGVPPQHQPKDDTSTDNTKEVDTTHSEATEAKPAGSPTTTPSQPLPSSTQTSTAAAAPAAVSLDSQTESASC